MGTLGNNLPPHRIRRMHAGNAGVAVPRAHSGHAHVRAFLLGRVERFDRGPTSKKEWECSGARDEVVAGVSGGGSHKWYVNIAGKRETGGRRLTPCPYSWLDPVGY